MPAAATPDYRAARRWNIVWVVPILALLIGGWMIWRNTTSQGPVARVRFETADGIAARQTEVRCRSVRVGVVKTVKLADDLKSVLVFLELDPDYEKLLRSGTRFWVVRPRFSGTNVTGVDTLIKGAYIELDPGPETNRKHSKFKGLETPPVTNRSIPGRRLVLTAGEAGSLNAGSPIYYRGFEVGRIENRRLDVQGGRVAYDAFILQEYSQLVTENTRFWNTSGIDIVSGADGIKVRTPSFQAMLSGGATFGVPEAEEPGNPVPDGTVFTLFPNEDDADGASFNPTMKFVLLFDQSIRGLVKSAPVEFRGIPIGRVADISFNYLQSPDDSRIPVLIEMDPSLLRREAAESSGISDEEFLAEAVVRGLRTSLKTGNLLTGKLFVDLDYYKDQPKATLSKVGEYSSLPTIPGGLGQLEAKVTAILDKINSLPLDTTMERFATVADEAKVTVAEARLALKEIQDAAAAARKTLDSPEFAKVPQDLRDTLAAVEKSVASVGPDGAMQGDLLRTLDELRASLRSMKSLMDTIEQQPNSLIFDKNSSGNPIPKAPRKR